MEINREEHDYLVAEILRELGGRLDGGRRNIIARCPLCSKEGKYGIYIGKPTPRKEPFMAHCFSCGHSTRTLEQLLEAVGRMDLMITKTANPEAELNTSLLFPLDQSDEVDDDLTVVPLPDFYRRTFSDPYLKSRGFTFDDYEYFAVGTTRALNFRYEDYVIFPIIDQGDTVGFVARHKWPKETLDSYNRKAKPEGKYRILRYRNSTENHFVKLLYNYDSIRKEQTDTVMVVEGVFDVVALTRKLALYDNPDIAVVATFGKKISDTQIYKLQCKGVRTVVLGFDGDAVETIKKTASQLSRFFEVFIADIPYVDKDWEDLSFSEIHEIFSTGLKTPIEYKLKKLQEQ